MTAQHKEWKDPDSDVDVPKTVKKAAISWLVPGVLAAMGMAFLAMIELKAKDMLKDYQTIQQAKDENSVLVSRVNDYATQVGKLQETLYLMDKKLDHLQDEFNYLSRDNINGRVLSPKGKDNNP